nr:MAG TPA: hypothetical protein [Caudoviricetes sp.]
MSAQGRKKPPDCGIILTVKSNKESVMKNTKRNGGGTPQGAHRAGDDPSTRREHATGRLCAVLRGAGGGAAWV